MFVARMPVAWWEATHYFLVASASGPSIKINLSIFSLKLYSLILTEHSLFWMHSSEASPPLHQCADQS